MGNQQTSDYSSYYNFVENDSDSGFGDLSSSPFELNKNTSFNYLYEQTTQTTSTPVPSPEAILNVISSRKNSLIKSKSIHINHSLDVDDSSSFQSSNLISSSWSPNSTNIKQTNQNKEERIPSKAIPIIIKEIIKQENTSITYPISFRSGMNFVGRVARGVKDFYNEINPATLTGAIDVVVVQQQDGSFRCSPFHVRFGKLGVIRSKEKIVDIEINGQKVDDLHMILGEAGEAFFVEKVTIDLDNNECITACDLATVTVQELSALIAASTLTTTKTTISLNVKQSQSTFDLTSTDNNKILLKSFETTPQKTQPIPIITSPKSIAAVPLTINIDTSPDVIDLMSSKRNDLNKQNFFSDGELTPELTSPAVSRPPTPKSDTELEVYKMKRSNTTNDVLNQWNWHWGELPSRQNSKNSKLVDANELNKTLSEQLNTKSPSKILGMFNLISKDLNKDGIYLDETEKLDSEVAALYLDQKSNSHQKSKQIANNKDDDQESGNGQSLPQSPLRDYYSVIGDVQLSLCGSNQDSNEIDTANFEELFQQYTVSYEKFSDEFNTITMNPNLIVKINNKYMNWQSAAPIILSAVVFNKNLNSNEDKNKQEQQLLPAQQINQQSNDKKESWVKMFGWGKSKTSTPEIAAAPATLTTINAIQKQTTVHTNLQQQDTTELEMVFNEDVLPSLEQIAETELVKSIESSDSLSNEQEQRKPEVHYRKTTRLSSDLINKLNLQPGSNEIQYSVTTALQGTTRITSYIFLWYYDDKVIVSDIDGTITKSDVWGQVLPIFGRDWSQAGVADLFTAIERNQYKFMYLSARAIGQSKITRDLLRNINQGGYTLPEGPLLVTPTSLFTAFQKEVIEKKPEEFKISCLKDIQSLFPSHNPYYAGYGNKSSDVKSYRTVGIPESRIFTINPQGEVKHEVSGAFQSSYSKLCDYVDLIFPPFKAPLEIKAEYDSFNYWRDLQPLTINDEIEREIIESLKEAKDANNNSKDSKAKKSLKVQQSSPLAITTSASKLALTNSTTNETN